MSQAIPTHYAVQYASNIEMLLQQRGSKLSGTVRPQSITGAKAATPVEQIGATNARKRTTRYPTLTPVETPHERPWVYPSDYDWMDLVDSIDKLRMVVDPQSAYVQSGQMAMGRAMDDEIIAAYFGDRKTGEDGATTTAFPAGQQVAVNFGASGNVGLTVTKIREARRLLMAAEVDLDSDPLIMPMTAKQHDNLLAEIQVISMDYNDRPVMQEGKVARFLGFEMKHVERLLTDGSSFRRVPAYAKSGMVLATWNTITTDISIRRDLAGMPYQVYVYGTFGATRLEERKMIEIKCSEA